MQSIEKKKLTLDKKQKLNLWCAAAVVICTAVFVVTASSNIVARSSAVYSFYFNDTRVVDKISTSYGGNRIADEFSGYFNSFTREPFDLTEYTGYEYESVFSEVDGMNLLRIKRVMDASLILCLVTGGLALAAALHLYNAERKLLLRDMSSVCMPLCALLMGVQVWFLKSQRGHEELFRILRLMDPTEKSRLSVVLGPEYINFAGSAFLLIGLIMMLAAVYIIHRATRNAKIFY